MSFSFFHPYGLLIGIGCVIGILISQHEAARWKFPAKMIEDALIWIIIPAIIGARVYHLATDWQLYNGHPLLDYLAIWNGGLGIFGALAGGILGLIAFSNAHKKGVINHAPTKTFFTLLDLLAFGAPFAQAIGRFGNYINSELYGLPTTLPWAIKINGVGYHPLFAYESVLMVCVGILLLGLSRNKLLVLGKGQYALVYLYGYASVRFWLEFLRIQSPRPTGALFFFSYAQWISLCVMLFSILLFWIRRHAHKGVAWESKIW
ncbi:MAG TPA: prolipoprotein diacylglyceryl transferase [Patescibacteria group bacterium]|nr:prolipoprotein diacylglyceryl transferase [Patescibacteria group bacterium]